MSTPTTALERALEAANKRSKELEGILDKAIKLDTEFAELRKDRAPASSLWRDVGGGVLPEWIRLLLRLA